MGSNSFAVGDRVWYVIAGIGELPPIWVAAIVVKVTARRVGVRPAIGRRSRFVGPGSLTTECPPPDAMTITFPHGIDYQPVGKVTVH